MVYCKCMPYISLKVNSSVLGWGEGTGFEDSGHGVRGSTVGTVTPKGPGYISLSAIFKFHHVANPENEEKWICSEDLLCPKEGGEVVKYNIFDREVWNPFLHFLHRVSSNNIESVSLCNVLFIET